MEEPEQSDPARIYEEYLGRTIADPWTRILLEYASVGSGERVLDLACGTGSVARQVAPIVGERGKVTALDVNPGMLAVARSLDPPDGAYASGDPVLNQLDGHRSLVSTQLLVDTWTLTSSSSRPSGADGAGTAKPSRPKSSGHAGIPAFRLPRSRWPTG